MILKQGMIVSSTSGIKFTSQEDCSFKFSSSFDPMEISIYESSNNVPVTYLLKKQVKV